MENIFSLDIQSDAFEIVVSLIIKYHGMILKLTPCKYEDILRADIERESGHFYSYTCCSSCSHSFSVEDFSFSWSLSGVTFNVGRDGAGLIEITIPITPELLDSFHKILREWQEVVKSDSHNEYDKFGRLLSANERARERGYLSQEQMKKMCGKKGPPKRLNERIL